MRCPYKVGQRVKCISRAKADALCMDSPFDTEGAGFREGLTFKITKISKLLNRDSYILWGGLRTNGVYAEFVEPVDSSQLLNNDYYS